MLNIIAWIGRFLLSSKGLFIGVGATFFKWLLSSKVFWCFIALYTCVRSALALYRWIVGEIVSAINAYTISSPSGSLDVLALANSVVPIDEIGVAFVMLGTAYALRFGVRWMLTAYKIVPFKAT